MTAPRKIKAENDLKVGELTTASAVDTMAKLRVVSQKPSYKLPDHSKRFHLLHTRKP